MVGDQPVEAELRGGATLRGAYAAATASGERAFGGGNSLYVAAGLSGGVHNGEVFVRGDATAGIGGRLDERFHYRADVRGTIQNLLGGAAMSGSASAGLYADVTQRIAVGVNAGVQGDSNGRVRLNADAGVYHSVGEGNVQVGVYGGALVDPSTGRTAMTGGVRAIIRPAF